MMVHVLLIQNNAYLFSFPEKLSLKCIRTIRPNIFQLNLSFREDFSPAQKNKNKKKNKRKEKESDAFKSLCACNDATKWKLPKTRTQPLI